MAWSQLTGSSFRKQSVAIFLIRAVPAIGTVLVIILLSRGISLQLYGAYQNFWVQLLTLNAIAMLGIPAIALTLNSNTLVALLKQAKWQPPLIWFAWLCLLSGVFAYLQYTDPVGISPLISFLFSIMYGLISLGEGLLLPLQRFKGLIITVIVYTAVFIALHIAFVQGIVDLEKLFFWLLILFTARAAVLLLMLFKGGSTVEDEQKSAALDVSRLKGSWLQLGIYDMGQILFRYADKFLVARFLPPQSLAIYFNGAQEIPLLAVFLGAIKSAALMQLAITEEESTERTLQIVNRSAAVLSSVVFPVFYFLLCFREELFGTILSAKYLPSANVFMAALFVLPLRSYNFTGILQSRHKGTIMNWGALLDAIIALALVYPLYQLFGLPGIAMAFVISTYIQSAFYIVKTAQLLNVSALALLPWQNWLTKAIVFALLFIGGHYVMRHFFTVQNVLLLGVMLWAITTIIALRLELQKKVQYGKAS